MNEAKPYEIVDLYPLYGRKHKYLIFSAHVYFLTPLDLDVRGFKVNYQHQGDTAIHDPTEISYDHEAKKIVRYPVIKFIGKEQEKMILELHKDLEKEAKKHFLNFSFTENFPTNYKQYLRCYRKKPHEKPQKKLTRTYPKRQK